MKTLHAGPLVAGYENGFLRRIRYGETEVLRMIYFALRDRNWNTMEADLKNERLVVDDSSFAISYECTHLHDGRPVMKWDASIRGDKEGTITFDIHGTMLEAFTKNRAGFCVLHPLTIAGADCTIVHPDGSEKTEIFPVEIDPENPFREIRSMHWKSGGIRYALDFEGDIFETEDQRNWCDASYKTFCTPLRLPFPADMQRGESVVQKITFRPLEKLKDPGAISANIVLRSRGKNANVPAFGIGASTEVKHLTEKAIANIRSLRLSHYRVEVYPASDNWVADFSGACETAYSLGLSLEVALHLTDNYQDEMEAFAVLCQQNKVRLKRVILLSARGMVTSQAVLDDMMKLKTLFPRVLFGAGTNYNFNEINKNRFNPGTAEFISLAADPQEHAFDDLTILENIAALEHLIKSTKAIYGQEKPVQLSPLTLRKRFNPYATNPNDLFIEERLKADPRQKGTFAVAWTFGSICALARGGASAVTFFQTAGNQGIMSGDGETYPVYDVFKRFSPYQGKAVAILDSSDPLAIEGLVIDDKVIALVNYSQEERTADWQGQYFVLQPREVKFIQLNSTQ